ncbi:MAG: tetratricopeptide repeat protein, partial [Chthoniobacterales bacterium]
RSPAALIASLAYEILGGMSAPGLGPYVPLAELSQEANAALREVFQNPQHATTATTLILKVIPAQKTASATPAQHAEHAPRKTAPPRRRQVGVPPTQHSAPEQASAETSFQQAVAIPSAHAAKSKTGILIGAAAAALVVLAGGAFFLMRDGDARQTADASASVSSSSASSVSAPAKSAPPAGSADKLLAEAKRSEDRQDFVGALSIYAQILGANASDTEAKRRAENSIARLEEKAGELGSNTQLLEALRSLAGAGLERASFFLGLLLRDIDPAESVKLFTAAAQQGDRRAMLALGKQLAKGGGVRRADLDGAAMWFKKAADAGDAEGMLYYGECLELGKGVPQNLPAAAALYSKAVALGDVAAKSKLGNMYRNGLGVPKVDQAEAFRLFQEAAADGFLEAQGNLGVMYINGESVPPDPAKAVALWKDGAEKGDPHCMHLYAMSLEGGALGRPDPAAAREWYIKAARAGSAASAQWCAENGVDF